ncbi:DUF4157 domain-containing protein [Streptomyces sp. NPDC045251]|uniref:eCIS core domain-containing protein n=1 Tax=unclassified Streptomyces TaxID=2593676 RepID=UPI003404AAAE
MVRAHEEAVGDKAAKAGRTPRPAVTAPVGATAGPVTPRTALALQRSVGNRAVSRLVDQDQDQEQHVHGAGCGHGGIEDGSPAGQRQLLDEAMTSPSRPLGGSLLSEATAFYRNDLSAARIHDNPTAQRATAALGAQAMTVGTHVFLGPQAAGRKDLIGHELGHVDKNLRGHRETGNSNGAGVTVTDPGQDSERAAEADGAAFAAGAATAPSVVAQRAVAQHTDDVAAAGRQDAEAVGGGTAVQRVVDDPDLQKMLTPSYWEGNSKRNLRAKAEANKNKQRGQKVAQPKKSESSPRDLETVLTKVVPELLRRLETSSGGQLSIYRGMPKDQADAIVEWFEQRRQGTLAADSVLPMKGHFGDEEQATKYYNGDPAANVLLKFVLKPGAHDLLFSPEVMALAADGRGANAIRHSERFEGQTFQTASTAEGSLEGYVGVKSEMLELEGKTRGRGKKAKTEKIEKPAFSLQVDPHASRALFQALVESVVVVNG